jgi:hypothetical protein
MNFQSRKDFDVFIIGSIIFVGCSKKKRSGPPNPLLLCPAAPMFKGDREWRIRKRSGEW